MIGSVKQFVQSIRRRFGRVRWLILALTCLSVAGFLAGWYLWTASHFRAGRSALERRDFSDARDHFRLCLKAWPRSSQTHFLAARAARRLYLYDEAEEHLKACQHLGLSPDAVALERLLIRAQRGDPRVVRDLWARVEQGAPDTLQILEVVIQEYVRTYQLVAALRALELFLQLRPDDIDALLGRGWVWEQLFDFEAAVVDYRRAFERDPSNDAVRLRLAKTLLITGPASEAKSHFEHLDQQQAGDAALQLALARCCRQLGQTEEAKLLLDILLAKQPRSADVLGERGRVALDMGKPAEAEGWLRQAVALAPHERQTNYNLSQCLQQLSRKDEAQKYLDKVGRLDADLARIHELTRQVLKSPNDASLRYEAGIIFLRSGEEKKGVRWLEMALEQDPWHQPAHEALANYYKSVGQAHRRTRARLNRSKRPCI